MRLWLLIARLVLTVPAAYGAFLSGVGLLFFLSMNSSPRNPIDLGTAAYLFFIFGVPLAFFLGSIVTAWLPTHGRSALWTGIILQTLSVVPVVLLFGATGTKACHISYVAVVVAPAWWTVHRLKDAQPRKRPWFQFHLSTAIVLMFVAGGILWANLQERIVYEFYADLIFCEVHGRGLPLCFQRLTSQTEGSDEVTHLYGTMSWRYDGLAVDLVLALVVLLAVGSICEWLIRRRERKQ